MYALTAFKKYKSMQELQGKQKLNRAIPVCKFIRVLKNDSKRLQGDELLDLWLVRSRKEEQCYF